MYNESFHRRNFNKFVATSIFAASSQLGNCLSAADESFQFKYLLGSCMYGYMYLGEILPEVKKSGAVAIDLWPKPHGNQREQLNDLREEKLVAMLEAHGISLGCITQYPLGPFGLQAEMRLAQRLGCSTMVTGGAGPKNLKGMELKRAVAEFCEKMKPHLAVAEECNVTLAIENHANNLIDSADSLKWLAELGPSKNLGIALAPYHLPQDEQQLSELIRTLGDSIHVFYAWQHGMGCMERLPKEQEVLQMPGRGTLDFAPLIAALKEIKYDRWTEIFMHPVPRGIPIHETAAEVTAEINYSRDYLERLAKN
jgi:sugar phosphate isomerase/epimerase